MVPLLVEEERDRLMAWQLGVSLQSVCERRAAKLKLPTAPRIARIILASNQLSQRVWDGHCLGQVITFSKIYPITMTEERQAKNKTVNIGVLIFSHLNIARSWSTKGVVLSSVKCGETPSKQLIISHASISFTGWWQTSLIQDEVDYPPLSQDQLFTRPATSGVFYCLSLLWHS